MIGLVDGLGQLSDRYVYTPFGVEAPLDMSGNPFRYTGRKLDQATGLYYYRARYYDPEHGRFLETDPILYEDQMNLYAYVHNDPVDMVDPTGMRRGENLTDGEWKKLQGRGNEAADRAEGLAEQLRAGDKSTLRAFEKAYGKGSATEENLAEAASQLENMAGALRAATSETSGATLGNATPSEFGANPNRSAFTDRQHNMIAFTPKFYGNSPSRQRVDMLHEAHRLRVRGSTHLPAWKRAELRIGTTGSRYLSVARGTYQSSSFYLKDPAFQDCFCQRFGMLNRRDGRSGYVSEIVRNIFDTAGISLHGIVGFHR